MPSQSATPALPKQGADPRKIPDLVLRNIRGAAAFAALNEVFATKVTNNDGKRIEMAKHFWGDDECNTGSCLRKLLDGREAFATLFDLVPTPAGHDLYVREHFSGGLGRWAVGKHFNEEVLSHSAFKKPDSARVTGRTLYDNASDVILCNCKKAMSLVSKLVPKIIMLGDDGSIVGYASGEGEDDFLRHINDGMYMMLKKASPDKDNTPGVVNLDGDDISVNQPENLTTTEIGELVNGDDPEEEKENETVDVEEDWSTDKKWKPFGGVAPLDYSFPGYFAFACFGPSRGIYFSDLINPKGNTEQQVKQGKKTSRVAQREEESKKQKAEREYGSARGLRMEVKVQLASVAQSEESASMREREAKIAMLVSIISSKEKTRECKMQLLNHVDNKVQMLQDIESLNGTIELFNDELKELSAEKRETSKIVLAVMREAEQSMGIDCSADNTI
jgi:hypothetical protein